MAESDVLTQPLAEISPMSPEVLACPHQFNQRLRKEAPLYHCPHTGIYFVSDYDTITKIAKDHVTFSNRFALATVGDKEVDPRIKEIQAQGYPPVDTMLTQDPPVHRRYRGMVNQAFTARRVATLEPEIEKVCHKLIDEFIDRGEAEFVVEFCEPVPMIVIAEQLGVPLADYELFKSWSDAFVAQLSRMATPDEEVAAAKLIVAYQHYFAERIEERRKDPHDDIISDIVHAKFEDERPLDIPEMLSIIQQLLVAGNETTTNAIAECVLMWIKYQDQFAKLKANRDLVPNLVEEILRLSTPTANMWRVVTIDTEIQGTPIPAGSTVQIRFSSANRDEQKFPNPHRFDVERDNAKSNIAFGYGVHMCIGASLARKEMDVAFRVLLERFDEFELACDESELSYAPNVLLRGLSRLPVRFKPA
ncbi:MAG: cytochrome P450 [Gammaproteobacteria bacterium]|nr:cytochrome P450 [Gammaproteobacteria bacterium]